MNNPNKIGRKCLLAFSLQDKNNSNEESFQWRSWIRLANDSYKSFNLSAKTYEISFCLNEFFGQINSKGVRTNGKKIRTNVFLSLEKTFFGRGKNTDRIYAPGEDRTRPGRAKPSIVSHKR